MSFFCTDCCGDHYPACGDKVEPAFFSWLQNRDSVSQKFVRDAMDAGNWDVYRAWRDNSAKAEDVLLISLRARRAPQE
jgi:hypothetical protein